MAYITLDELKKMTNEELYDRWQDGVFPFDFAECSNCIAQHRWFANCHHYSLRQMVQNFKPKDFRDENIRHYLDEIYALRLFYRDLYANNPPELDEIPVVKEKETVVEV